MENKHKLKTDITDKTKAIKCEKCKGEGYIPTSVLEGWSNKVRCPECKGTGVKQYKEID